MRDTTLFSCPYPPSIPRGNYRSFERYYLPTFNMPKNSLLFQVDVYRERISSPRRWDWIEKRLHNLLTGKGISPNIISASSRLSTPLSGFHDQILEVRVFSGLEDSLQKPRLMEDHEEIGRDWGE